MSAVTGLTVNSSDLLIKLQKLLSFDSNFSFFKILGETIKLIYPSAIITVNEYVQDGHVIIRYINGYEEYSKLVLPILGKEPFGLKIKVFPVC